MNSASEIVQQFLKSVESKDYAAARTKLADDLSFVGPIDTFNNPESYIGALKKLGGLVERIDIKKTFVDGNDVNVLCELIMKAPAPAVTFVSEWYQVKNGKISAVRVVFDARPFAAMFAK